MDSSVVAVTLGIGRYRNTAEMAAARFEQMTRVRTRVLDDRDVRGIELAHPTLAKLYLFDIVGSDRIVFFDPDVVVLREWDLAQLLDEPALVAVRDRFIGDREHGLGVPRVRYFNAGMFIANRAAHAGMFRYARALWRDAPQEFRLLDQSLLNVAAHRGAVRIRWLPQRYNFLHYGRRAHDHVVLAHFTRGIDQAHRTLASLAGAAVQESDVPTPRGSW
ncbi:MAG TPA: glycosyltransferase [Frankiaceae bacterium]|nr:glycosyltransferase [Frankiaceae bacterium]